MRVLNLLMILFSGLIVCAQPTSYSAENEHSHNDYEQATPFWSAWKQGFGSIEADIFLHQGVLLVAHEKSQLKNQFTLDSLYLAPLQKCILQNKGQVYTDSSRFLQLMIDIKTEARSTLSVLAETLKKYPVLINCPTLIITISGNRPDPNDFFNWPTWIHFDAVPGTIYPTTALAKVEMFSDNFKNYSSWNGKGRIPESEKTVLQSLIEKTHQAGKKIRFWNAPDGLNSWYAFTSMGVDYINTDQVEGLGTFFRQLPDRFHEQKQGYDLYQPQWRNDGLDKPVKNIILLIGDGTGLPQWYSGYTANRGKLNVFNMKSTGYSKTSSYDNYITDSAPGATAFSTGQKTNNRAVGVDHTGKKLRLIPDIIRSRGMKTGIITSGDLRDATPAAFYAHQSERSNYKEILNDLLLAPVDIIMGACELPAGDSILLALKKKFTVKSSVDSLTGTGAPLFVADMRAALSVQNGRGNWALQAFRYSTEQFEKNKAGFFLMLEGAQIDHGGHANKLPYVVTELLDFDLVIGEAMRFADSNGETLVIVTGDHETGGLTLTDGDYT
ncbi:MAG TPA: alkaline phosphatase, partial [Chitinophagaceae bacterium]|nr:alkaline phosphatase [Chitinophagaceae bacterium]